MGTMTTRVFVFDAATGALRQTIEGPAVGRHLAALGIDYERWPVRSLPDNADQAAVFAVYGDEVQRLANRHGYQSVDVVRIKPDAANRAEARAKFLEEHVHEDDETRFFVEGSGIFYLHLGDQVHAVLCTAGDLLRVPARTQHWFDMGTAPRFCAIRLFTTADGWQAKFTGDPIARRHPFYDALVGA